LLVKLWLVACGPAVDVRSLQTVQEQDVN